MFLARLPESDIFILGPQKPYHHLYFLRSGDPPYVTTLDLGSRGSDNLAFDPDDPSIVYVGAGNWLYQVSAASPRIIKSVELDRSIHNLNFLHFDSQGDRFFISKDIGDQIFVVDRKTFRIIATIPSPYKTLTDDVWLDPAGDLVLVDSRYFIGRRVDTYDRSTLRQKKTYFWPWDYGFNFSTLDPDGRRVYLASTVTGKVRVLDLDTLTPADEFRLESGIRNLNFDSERRWLLIGSYFKGRLFVYDVDRKKVIGHLFLGSRLRWVHVDAENRNWYAATSVGGFEISPDEAFSKALAH